MKVNFAGAATKLLPVAVLQSSIYDCSSRSVDCGTWKCIDGLTNDDLCHTNAEPAPWLALDFGEEAQVSVEKTVLLNRKDQSWNRTRNIEVWLADEIPTTAMKPLASTDGSTLTDVDGHMLGTFEGPATSGQEVEIESGPGWKKKMGRYLIIQINNGTEHKHFLVTETEKYADAQGGKRRRRQLSSILTPGRRRRGVSLCLSSRCCT